MLNRRQARPARVLRRAAILGPLLLALLPLTPARAAIKGGGFVWVNRLTFTGTTPPRPFATLSKYEFSGAHVNSLNPKIDAFGRGMAVDGADLFYSVVDASGVGDGRIHWLVGGASDVLLPDPSDDDGDPSGIGALDFNRGTLWAISLNESPNVLYGIDLFTQQVMASCSVVGSFLTDTLAVKGGTFLTDGGGTSPLTLTEYELPIMIGAGSCVSTGESFTLSFGVRGIDHVHGSRLLASDGSSVHDLGRRPYAASLGSFPVVDGWDISVTFK